MKRNATKQIFALLILIMAAGGVYWLFSGGGKNDSAERDILSAAQQAEQRIAESTAGEEQKEAEGESAFRQEAKKARYDYFHRLLRDPATDRIPENIRSRELQHAQTVPTIRELKRQLRAKNPTMQVADGFEWRLAGPPAVGGRTRALGIDQRNADIIIAGGVSGGIWKSTNGGDNWTIKTPDFENFSVTSLAQDPLSPDTWYYTAGEITSGSPGAPGASYYGTGIFRSTDNGESWSRIPGTADENTRYDSQFDFVNRIRVNPSTGTVYVASNGFGIFRSPGGNSYDDLALGGFGEHLYADVTVAPGGRVVAVLSQADAGQSGGNPGIFVSDNDGQSWTEITPSTFPGEYNRSVITMAPSDPDIVYVLTQKSNDDSNQGVAFFKIDLSAGISSPSASDRSANLPDFGEPVGGVNLQGGYNMTLAVKPDDPNFVTLGGTNLFRSPDGFATAPSGDSDAEKNQYWIGGYAKANNVSQYPDQHPDQHIQVYDPANPDRLWVGHDGGLSVTDDVEAASVSWTGRDEGYIVTQFYDASIAVATDDNRLMGGTQDNGTPFFEFAEGQQIGGASADISSGDGGYSFFTENYIYVSNQQSQASGNNRIIRFNGDFTGSYAIVQPASAQTAFFINPYTIDPNDEGIMYYPGGSDLYRNTQVDQVTSQINNGATQGWERLSAAEVPGYNISALEVSMVPADILYYAGSADDLPPVVKRLDNASNSNSAPVDISIPGAPAGAFVHDIAVNPVNSNDVLVLMSNYNIVGLYHTSDGGSSWEAVEGNLVGVNDPTSPNPGPSLRSATIVPATTGPIYILGTSTGVYATETLGGSNTQWGRESAFDTDGLADIGFSIVENIDSRFSDGNVAIGTHGRGMFLGRFQGQIAEATVPSIALNPVEGRAGTEVVITATNFQFSTNPAENEVYFGDVRAEIVEATTGQLTVRVPRATLDPTSDDRTVFVNVTNPNGADPQAQPFTVLPPTENRLDQSFPNPFSTGDTPRIPVSLQRDSRVTLIIYDISGRRVDQPLKEELYQAGTYNIPVDFSGHASGIYIYRLIAEPTVSSGETYVDSRKLTFIK